MGLKRSLLIVDDHPVFRDGLSRVINQERDLAVAGEAADAVEALTKADAMHPDLVLIDIALEGMNGLELTKALRERHPDMRLLVLSMHPESLHAERALRAGANGYVMKRENGRTLLAAIRHVLDGKTYVSSAVNELMIRKATGQTRAGQETDTLSDREFEIFQLIGQGFNTRRIAEKLNVSMKTVETHREHIKSKLHIDETADLVQRAIHWTHHEEIHKNKLI